HDPRARSNFAYYETIAGGMGASMRWPGESGVHTHMTNSWNTPVEALENQYPLRVRSYQFRHGSGGRGRNSGGDGLIREIEFLTPCEVTILSDRRNRGPYGLSGGQPGRPGRNSIARNGRVRSLPAKTNFRAGSGEVLRIETPGGGG